jgi:DNA (cytosine-5)-methyltransferase 1
MRHATGNQYPRIAVWENVPGALSSNKGADFSAVLDSLADSGALAIEWAVLDAQHFGVPQRRRRIFLVAVYDPAIARNCGTQIFPVTQGSRRNTKKVSTAREEVAGTLGGGSGSRGWSPDTDRMTFVPVETPFVKVTRPASNQHPEIWRKEETCLTLNAFDNTGESRATVIFTAQRVGEPPRIYENTTPSLLSRMGTGGNNVPMIAKEYGVRRLTPLECERLMGWPDDHTAGQADSHRYKQCGNGVAAPVAQWVAQQLNRIIP